MVISVRNLVKEYKVRKKAGGFKGLFSPGFDVIRAVDGITFDVEEGELYKSS